MMNKSLRGGGQESSDKVHYGFREVRSFIEPSHSGVRIRDNRTDQKRAAVTGGF